MFIIADEEIEKKVREEFELLDADKSGSLSEEEIGFENYRFSMIFGLY